MPPLQVVQVASWPMHPASTRATSQVALAPGLGPKGGEHASSPFWSDVSPWPAGPQQRAGS